MMKRNFTKRILSVLLSMVMLIGILPTAAIPVFAEESEEQPSVDSEGYILIWSYEQLVSVAKTATRGERYRLATDIYQTDSTNDLMIRVQNLAYFSLDLNGHVLSRSTRSLDSAMILVRDNSTLYIYDSSPDKTGTCIYNISGASGTCSVIDNDGGDVIINGGNYIIEGETIPGSAAVLLGYSGSFTVYDGTFDSTNARDGVSVRLFMNTFTDGPNCIIYGGRFYSQRTCINASCWDNYAKSGGYYPYVFVLGGEFYTRKITGDEYEGNFAYCSNFWGRVIVANGLVPARSLNARDQRYATGTTKTVEKLTGAPGNGWEYATVTPPPRIVSEQMPLGDRLYSMCWRDYLKSAKENESYDFWTANQEAIEAELAKIDGFSVNIFDTEVVLSIEDKEEIESVRWYVSDSPDSDWTELVDYQNSTGPVTQDPPRQGETLYYRAEVTRKDGTEYEDIIYVNCEEPEKGYAYEEYQLSFNVTPEGEGEAIDLTRTVKQSDTFEMSWRVPSYLGEGVVCRPEITVTRPKSNIAPKTYLDSKVTINYSVYPNDVIVNCRLYVLLDGRVVYFEKTYNVDVKRIYTATDGCIHCYAAGEDGWNEIEEGGSCSFKIYPKDYYELTDPDKLEVSVNGDLVTPDANGVYTVENVTKDLDIYCDGTGFTSYSNLTIAANGKTVTEKIFNGGTYTFKTLAEFGATVPEGSTFTGWKIGNKTYQPGETYTVPGGGEIKINAAFTGLHTITVENGKAYADEAHTIPISAAAEDQVIYIVADPAPEGKVFSYWKETYIASYGGDGWFGDYASAETTYTVYYSDVVLAPVYETPIDHIVINGMTKPSAGVAIDNSDYTYKWGCSVPANSGYSLGINYWYDITDGEPEFAMRSGDVFRIGHTYRYEAKITLYGDTILAAKEDISVTLNGIDAEDYEWTISEYSQIYENMLIYFEFTCEREEPDTALICPKGDGTSGNPFQITNIGELYWFAAFVNGTASYPDGVTVARSEACAIVMNDITVNPGVLTEDGELNGTSGFAQWTPIAPANGYKGTFDGQDYAISGICYNPGIDTAFYSTYYAGLFGCYINDGGIVRNLTLKDTYIGAPREKSTYDAGGIAGMVASGGTVENCHFDGTVTADDTNGTYTIGGIAGRNLGVIRNCTTKGLVKGYTKGDIGGIAGKVVRYTEDGGYVIGCVNEATVKNTRSDNVLIYTGGIAGELYNGNIRDCCNKGNVSAVNDPAGIVSYVYGDSSVIRCWNEGDIEGEDSAGIVSQLRATVKNCYNTGSVNGAGIVARPYSYCSITYCHNVGDADSIVSFIDSYATIENCYYLADSETDVLDGTTAKTADQFADGTVLALLNSSENAGNWEQGEDDEYPVLGEIPGVTVSGTITSFGSTTDTITVELWKDGATSATYSTTTKGNTATYSFGNVAPATYTLKIRKPYHLPVNATIIVTEDTVVDVELKAFSIAGANMTLGNELSMNFFVKKTDIDSTRDYYIKITKTYADGRANVVKVIEESNWTDYNSTYYSVKFDGVAAKEMADTIYVQVFYDDDTEASNLWTDSVANYALRILENQDSCTKTMLVDMLNYGAAAQEHFNYNTSNLANSVLSATQKGYATTSATAKDYRVQGTNYYGTNLTLENSLLMNMFFNNITPDMYAVVTFTSHTGAANNVRIEGSEFIKYNSTTYRVPIEELVIADGRQLVTCKVYTASGTLVASATDSMESYIARMSTTGALYTTIMKFADSAHAYFHNR